MSKYSNCFRIYFMFQLTLIISLECFLISCGEQSIPVESREIDNGDVSFTFRLGKIAADVLARVEVVVSGASMEDIRQDLTIDGDTVSGTVQGIPAGDARRFTLNGYDAEGKLIYSGFSQVDMPAGQTVAVHVTLRRIGLPGEGFDIIVDASNPEAFLTIGEAIDAADDGNRIFIAGGTYIESITIDKQIHLIGDGEVTLFANTGNAITVEAGIDTNTVIEGMTIIASAGIGIDLSSGGSPIIQRCIITKCRNQGILSSESAAIIRANRIVENGIKGQGAGVSLNYDSGTVVANNLIKGQTGNEGIYIQGSGPIIKNNVIIENYNGVVIRNKCSSLIANNIIIDNSNEALYDWDSDSNPALFNNCIFPDDTDFSEDFGNISVNPRFVDPDTDDYHLDDGSSCIDAGMPGTKDADPDGSRNDMGMYGGPWAIFW